ncbi:MAG: DUF2807 domain-containing protein [Marinoscillum sp.]
MKQSKKVLSGVGIAILVMFLISVFFLKQEAKLVVANYQAESNFRTHEVGTFDRIVFGSGWDVIISGMGGEFVSIQHNDTNNPKVRNDNGTLYFEMTRDSSRTAPVSVNIRAENIEYIKAASGTNIHLVSLEIDSLSVEVEDHQSLATTNCAFGYFTITSEDGIVFESKITE